MANDNWLHYEAAGDDGMDPKRYNSWLANGRSRGNLVVSMAKEAGIKNIYKSYINAQNKLDAYPLKL